MDFRSTLENEYLERRRKNPRYSLRRYAQTLGLNSGSLSQILAGKRALSLELQIAVLKKLGKAPALNQELLPVQEQMNLDQFQLIAEWYHFAILELLELPAFKKTSKNLSARLGLSEGEVIRALNRLERLGVVKHAGDIYRVEKRNLSTLGAAATHEALRSLQRQLVDQSQAALELVAPEERDHSGLTVAIPTRLLPEAKERIKRFRRELNQWLSEAEGPNEVYQLSIAFFPIAPESYLKTKKGVKK